MNLRAWVSALRLRTLPLSASGIILGGFIGYADNPQFSWQIFLLTLATALLLQILSNLANDYGDYTHGTDNDERLGPMRSVQSGKITPKQMKRAIVVFSVVTFAVGLCLLLQAFNYQNYIFILFLILGITSIIAAIKYTVGSNNYGYQGFGDIMVFIFFGLVAVMGTYFLQTNIFNYKVLIPATSIGLLSMGVLNLNNMRDIENDKKSNKRTLAVKLGSHKSKIYHTIIISTAMVLTFIYLWTINTTLIALIILIPAFILIMHIAVVLKNTNPQNLDKQLKVLSLSTLFYSFVFGIVIIM